MNESDVEQTIEGIDDKVDTPEQEEIKFEIHPKAAENFNERAEELLTRLIVRNRKPMPAPSAFANEIVPDAVITSDQIRNLVFRKRLPGGNFIDIFLQCGEKEIGYEGNEYKEYAKLCESLASCSPFGDYISIGFINHNMSDWVRERYTGSTSKNLLDYLVPKCITAIRTQEIWIPIGQTHIETEIRLPHLTVQPFNKKMFDKLRTAAEVSDHDTEWKDKCKQTIDSIQKQVKGVAAVTMFVTAEAGKAYQIALSEAEKIIAIMRLFSKAVFTPNLSSCCVPKGQKEPRGGEYYAFRNGFLCGTSSMGSMEDDVYWRIKKEDLARWSETGFGNYLRLITTNKLTEFEKDALQSVMIYSRAMLGMTPSDKLMYIFSALETLMLKDNSENLQQNIADRIAFTISDNRAERIKIVKNYKAAYSKRSLFVHHGQTVEDFDLMTEFLRNVWTFFFILVGKAVYEFKTKEEFIEHLDGMKYD
jgi:hypothetical protein